VTPLSFTKVPQNFSGWRRAFLSLIIIVGAQVVMAADFTRTTALNQSVPFSNSIQFVDFSATVTPASDEGTIQFTLKEMNRSTGQLIPVASPITSTTLSNGFAGVSYPVPAGLAPGGYSIVAEYSGTGNFLPSHHVESILTIYPPGSRSLRATNITELMIPSAGYASIYPSDIAVTGVAGLITNVAITLNGLTHPYPADLDILVVGPGGQRVVLFSNAGGGHSMDGIDVTISDWASFPIPLAFEVPYGTYRPTIYDRAATNEFSIQPPFSTALSSFNGFSPNGIWSLYVSDVEAPDPGIISGGWTLTLTTINSTPTISAIPDQTTDEDIPLGPIPFTVSDSETAASNLIITASSSNPTVATDENLLIDGSDGNLTFTIFPQPDQFGTTLITVIVGDGEAAATNTFLVTVNSVNDAPTISPIPDQTADEDTIVGPLLFSIGDIETPAAYLTVTVDSSNPLLTPPRGIILGGSDAKRFITITPALNQFGTATITLTVSDGQSIGTASFSLTINSTNEPPTISSLPDQTANEDTTIGPLEFTIGDVETPADDLVLSTTSSNPALVPPGNIVLGGTGTTRTVTITPAANQSGTATISIYVSDGITGASNSFLVTIRPVNDPPTASVISDQIANEDTVIGPITFTIGDVETAASDLSVSAVSSNPELLPAENIILSSVGSDRTVTLVPAPDQSGASAVTIIVSDGENTVSNTFLVTFTPVNDPPTFDPITDVIVFQDSGLRTIHLTGISPGAEFGQAVTINASSDHPELIPDPSVVPDLVVDSATLAFTPASGALGSAQITVTVKDNGGIENGGLDSFSRSFNVTVLPRPTLQISQSGGSFLLSFETVLGMNYIIESRNSLSDVDWTVLNEVPGTGGIVTVPESNSVASNSFYRVRVK